MDVVAIPIRIPLCGAITLACAASLMPAFVLASSFPGVHVPLEPHVTVATPLGVSIGKTSCNEAMIAMDADVQERASSSDPFVIKARNPGSLYTGAIEISAACYGADRPVMELNIVASKGGSGSSAVVDAHRFLSSRYELLQGGSFSRDGSGGAIYQVRGGDTVIVLRANPDSTSFIVSYQPRGVHLRLVEHLKTNSQAGEGIGR